MKSIILVVALWAGNAQALVTEIYANVYAESKTLTTCPFVSTNGIMLCTQTTVEQMRKCWLVPIDNSGGHTLKCEEFI